MEPGVSPWSPLRRSVFRSIWIASVASNVGSMMQTVGVGWLMTSLTPSPLLIALMQTATSLPIFLLGLPAGTFSDLLDRRKVLLFTEGFLLVMALSMGVLTLTGHISVWLLLGITFLMGLGAAFDGPAWQAILPDLVERKELHAAVSLNSTGYNIARALGPALGGIIVALAGPAAVFLLNAVSFLCVLAAIYFWRQEKIQRSTPPEYILGATVSGLRYVSHAPAMQSVLVRIAAFSVGASALWALLPIMARRELALDATWYGIVLGSLGFGAVSSALLLPWLRKTIPVDHLTALATLVFAGATLALAYLHSIPLLLLGLMAGGMAWLAMMSSLTAAAQTASPAWVRARTLAIYMLVFQGTMALSAFGWGILAERVGNPIALTCAAAALILGLATILRWPLRPILHLDLSYSMHWREPQIVLTPEPDDGPVLITVEHRVSTEHSADFINAMQDMRRFRYREGAIRWDLFRDLADPDRYLESFVAPSWAEHMRQHARVTVEDQGIEARAFAYQKPGVERITAHMIAARTYVQDALVEPPYAELS